MIPDQSILLDRSVDVNGGILVANGGRLVFKDNGPAGEMIKLSQVFKHIQTAKNLKEKINNFPEFYKNRNSEQSLFKSATMENYG